MKIKTTYLAIAILVTSTIFSQNIINEHFNNTAAYHFSASKPSVMVTSFSQPMGFYLGQSQVNPNENEVSIYFSVPARQNVKITVCDIFGKEIAQVVDEQLSAGTYKAQLNASSLSAGVYFYRMQSDNYFEIKKMTLIN